MYKYIYIIFKYAVYYTILFDNQDCHISTVETKHLIQHCWKLVRSDRLQKEDRMHGLFLHELELLVAALMFVGHESLK